MWIQWCLPDLLERRGIGTIGDLRWQLIGTAGLQLSPSHLEALVGGQPERLALPTLAALCEVLDCEPGDLLKLRTGSKPHGPGLRSVVDPDAPIAPVIPFSGPRPDAS